MKILLVDDEKDLVSTLSTILRKWGHDVISAYDGIEAQNALGQNSVDVVISDLIMPNLDGGELLTWINSMQQKPNFIIMSAYYNEGFIKYFSDQGITNILGKPIQFDKLQSMLNKFAAESTSKQETEPKEQAGIIMVGEERKTAGIPELLAKNIAERLAEAKSIVTANTTTGVPYSSVAGQKEINANQFAASALSQYSSLKELWRLLTHDERAPKEFLSSDDIETTMYQVFVSPELFVHVEVSPLQVTHGLLRMSVENALKETPL